MDVVVVENHPGPTGIYDPSVTEDLFFFSTSALAGAAPSLPFIDSTGMAKRVNGKWWWGGVVNQGWIESDGTLRKYEVPDAVHTPHGIVLASHWMPWEAPESGFQIVRQGQVYVMGGNKAGQGEIALRVNVGDWGPEARLRPRDLNRSSPSLRRVRQYTEPALHWDGDRLWMALTAHWEDEARIVLFWTVDLQMDPALWVWNYGGVLVGMPENERASQRIDHWTAGNFATVDGKLQLGMTPVVDGSYSGGFVSDVESLDPPVLAGFSDWFPGDLDLGTPSGMLTHDGSQWLFAQTDWSREDFLAVWETT